jgi:2-oxoglutarate ferredoxin oxidoreductase subunit alpha
MGFNLNIMVGGEAGQGVQSMGFILAKTFARSGYHVFADQDYESRIRGGHNFFRIRISDKPVGAVIEEVDILLALNQETVPLHRREMSAGGVVIFDGEVIKDIASGPGLLAVPLADLAEKSGGKVMANVVALGVTMSLLDYGLDFLNEALLERFGSGDKGQGNLKAAAAGYQYARENFTKDFKIKLKPKKGQARPLMNGNEALCLGAIAAGCTFLSAYPMTPATPIMEYMAAKADELGMVVIQTEDEIAAINVAIGAGFAGARAMTATSGSGFCLMVEGLGLAALTETPIVIVDGQRPGPAVGLPTRTEQGDLQFVLHAHHGDNPRAVLAPASIEDAFWVTARAFNYAEKYQIPVIILTDHYLATVYATVEEFDLSRVTIDRGELLTDAEVAKLKNYKRHKVTPSGVSPRALPMQGKALVVTDADEHNEAGHLTESASDRNQQLSKRLRKLESLQKEIKPPRIYGPPQATVSLIGWGSSYGALKEAVDILQEEGISANLLHLNELWPFPAAPVDKFMAGAGHSLVVESNATGQLARLIRMETGRKANGNILRFDGRPQTPASILGQVKKEVA